MAHDKNKTVLVTGGAGYIGAHACKALAQAGYTPVTFDNLSTGHAEAVKFGPLFQGDLTDRASIDAA
ncbi:MAG: NAD-dependent epimerase/dehydratase family protein, partial [Pseudomonadota bacterium]